LPIGDVMVAYAHVARPWFSEREHQPNTKHHIAAHWRWQIHALSMIVFLPAVVGFFRRKPSQKKDP